MDFDDSPEEADFRAEARAWLDANAVPKGGPGDFSAGAFSGEMEPGEYVKRCRWWQGQLYEGGWAGISWPREAGGRGGKLIEEAVFAEEQARYGVSSGVFSVAHGMVAPTLMQHATAEQQRRYLGPMLKGDELWCQLFSEPDAGSDLASLATRAVRDGDEFVVDGQKVWTSYAHESEWGILLARTSNEQSTHAGISFFVLDMSSRGVEVRPLRQMNGEAHFNEVFLNRVRVPAANVIGELGRGWKVAITTLSNERVAISGGSGSGDPDRVLELARSLGRSDDFLFRQEFARAWSRNEVIRYLRMRARTAMSQGRRAGPEGSVMKLAYARYVKHLSALSLTVQGPQGILAHPDALESGVFLQKFISAVQSSIGGGTDEIQRNIVGERVLGLPRAPR